MYVKHGFVHPIKHNHIHVRHALQHVWSISTAKFEFSQSLHSAAGTEGGLGPIAYIHRSSYEIQQTDHHRRLNAKASTVSTSNVLKTKLGDPALPLTVHDLIHVLH